MTGVVDSQTVLALLAADVPRKLHPNMLLTGSLAAAYHYRAGAHASVRTKDADVVVQPAGAIDECSSVAKDLLAAGWRPEVRMKPGGANDADDALRLIRLHPPSHDVYFVELLGMPRRGQREPKRWERLELRGTKLDGWYVVPCFRYMALFASDARNSAVGIAYASPPLMALANLLSHPTIGPEKIADSDILRSAKDLGRVLSLARLASIRELDEWPATWWNALQEHFPEEAVDLATRAGTGITALVDDGEAFSQAFELADAGLLTGRSVTRDNFLAVGEQLMATIADLHRLAGVKGF